MAKQDEEKPVREWVYLDEAARELEVSRATVYRMLGDGRLTAYRLGGKGRPRILTADLRKLLRPN